MDNLISDKSNILFEDYYTLRNYILLIRTNLKSFIIISSIIILIVIAYAIRAKSIYKSTVTLNIKKQQENILEFSTSLLGASEKDRFISNEIEIMNNYDSRERYAKALIDSFNSEKDKNIFSVLKSDDERIIGHKTVKDLTLLLKDKVSIEQISGNDIIEISAFSPSPYEAALIANTVADQYKKLNLEINRDQFTTVRKFLEEQKGEKFIELNSSEDTLMNFQEKGGIVSLDAQSTVLINQLAQLDAQKDAAIIDLKTSNEVLSQYKSQIVKLDPKLVAYLENQASQAYIEVLQKQIAEIQVNRDLAVANKNPNMDVSTKMKEYDQKIEELKQKLSSRINDIKAGAFASSPDQAKDLTQKAIEEEVHYNSLLIKLDELTAIINKYEQSFDRLPKTSIKLAQFERKRESSQQLYLIVEKKYQEAVLNELAQPGNVILIGKGQIPDTDNPDKPNRLLIILIGFLAGSGLAFGYLLIKDYFDNTIKTPEDIQRKNINVLTWVPHFMSNGKSDSYENDFIVMKNPSSASSEAFKVLRAHIEFSKLDSKPIKTILITSPSEQEGKTVVSVNLAGSYAQADKKTLIIDCDLRKPRLHKIMGDENKIGLVDYLFKKVKLEEAIKNSKLRNLSFITSGTIPPNPAEIIGSALMRNFLAEIRNQFDIVIIDSPPIVAVVDSEVLSRITDGTILIVSADKTEIDLMTAAIDLLKSDKVKLIGTVLNNFKNKSGYGRYHKYYYNYSSSNGKRGRKTHKT